MSGAPAISPEIISTLNPSGEPGRAALAQAAEAVTEQLASLAGQAEQWRHALLRTSGEIVSLADAYIQAGGDQGSASATAEADLLSGLLRDGSRAAWLHTGAVDPAAFAPVTTAPRSPGRLGARVEVLLAAWPGTRGDRGPEERWREHGAEIRVASHGPAQPGAPRDLVIVDRRLVAVAWRHEHDRIRVETVAEPAAAALLRTLWELLWAQALPLEAAVRLEILAGDEVKRTILEHLNAGAKDEMIARSLGISLRTCRRHIAEILAAAGAISRFQAGARLALVGGGARSMP